MAPSALSSNITIITKVKAISFSFCLLSIIMFVYILVQPSVYEKERHVNFNQYVGLFAASLTLLTNLLLYQATLQVTLSLTFWPNSNCCLLIWMIVHIIVHGMLAFNMVSCIYALSNKTNFSSNKFGDGRKEDQLSQTSLILLSVLLIMGQLLILIGMKIVFQFYEESNKDDGDEE